MKKVENPCCVQYVLVNCIWLHGNKYVKVLLFYF